MDDLRQLTNSMKLTNLTGLRDLRKSTKKNLIKVEQDGALVARIFESKKSSNKNDNTEMKLIEMK